MAFPLPCSRAATALAGAAILVGATPARSQTPEPASASSGVVAYPASYYEEMRITSAREMIERTPGFVLDKGDSSRGTGGGGNVLIDGERPASKSQSIDSVLSRIPSGSVERIEVIRGGAPGIDMQGQGVVANVVRKGGTSSDQALHLFSKTYASGFAGGFVRGELSWRGPGFSAEAQVSGRRDLGTDSGDGALRRVGPTGALIEGGDFDARIRDQSVTANAAGEYKRDGSLLRMNASAERQSIKRREIGALTTSAGAAFSETTRVGERDHEYEIGGDYERKLSDTLSLRLLALARTERTTIQASSAGRTRRQASTERSVAEESIARASLRRSFAWGELEAGGEGALNTLDARSALSVDGVPVALPSANVEVKEDRGELFTTASLRPAPGLSLEAGLRYESSTIRQTGGVSQSKTLSFAKPRASAAWTVGATQIRARVEREVGQLNFEDFAANSAFEDDAVNAGNADLEPETSWLFEGAVERRFWGTGAAVLTVSHAEVDDVVDLIPIAGRFDAPGNIGSGSRDVATLNVSFPTERLGLPAAVVRVTGTWRQSEVSDPVTGESRRISGEKPFEAQLEISRSLPEWRSTVGLEAGYGFESTVYRINEIRRIEEDPLYKFYWDWVPRPDVLMRFQFENFTARKRTRDRTVFSGPRSAGVVAFREQRTTRLPVIVTARARLLF
ncbi:TonB-dependent receptor plug domain-containing protein [Phenylobacterium sp.]|uniref:TonB-dependent receptor plug domain-containing protein n=1 Tax=Phenylobacterium sp. TaxID=1871053 RepID=UPI003D2AFF57